MLSLHAQDSKAEARPTVKLGDTHFVFPVLIRCRKLLIIDTDLNGPELTDFLISAKSICRKRMSRNDWASFSIDDLQPYASASLRPCC